MQETVARARFQKNIAKKVSCSDVQSSPGFVWPKSHCQRCPNVDRVGVTLLLCHAGLQPAVTKRTGTAPRRKASDVATLLASGIAAGGC